MNTEPEAPAEEDRTYEVTIKVEVEAPPESFHLAAEYAMQDLRDLQMRDWMVHVKDTWTGEEGLIQVD